MSEVLAVGIRFSLIGMCIVFGVLALISVVVTLIRLTDAKWQMREHAQAQSALEKPATIDDLTLVLISAAVATMICGRHRIRSVRRVLPGARGGSPWSLQGRATLHGSHLIAPRGQRHSSG